MNAPLYEALSHLARRDNLRCHMPGHAGRNQLPLEPYQLDVTEIDGTGNLYQGSEPIAAAQRAAADYFDANDCFFLTGGSTMGLQSALAACAGVGGMVAVDRNCHRAVCHAMALLDLTPDFLFPSFLSPLDITGEIAMEQITAALARQPSAMLITSPTYFGVRLDIRAIANACHRAGVPLIVDEAHGAHFPSLGIQSAVSQGADFAIVSAHKTMPCLGQGAFLLSSGRFDPAHVRRCMALFGTSSPSYLIMASMDRARSYLTGQGGAEYRQIAQGVSLLRQRINASTALHALEEADGVSLDPTRLTLYTTGAGLTGHEFSRRLYGTQGIRCEMATDNCVVLILTCAHTQKDLLHIAAAAQSLCPKRSDTAAFALTQEAWPFPEPRRRCSPRQALFAPQQTLPLDQAIGCVCAQAVTPYPPGVPLIYPGEEILQIHIELFQQKCYTLDNEIVVISSFAQH